MDRWDERARQRSAGSEQCSHCRADSLHTRSATARKTDPATPQPTSCPACTMRLARNWPKVPKPTMPILSLLACECACRMRASRSKGKAASSARTRSAAAGEGTQCARQGQEGAAGSAQAERQKARSVGSGATACDRQRLEAAHPGHARQAAAAAPRTSAGGCPPCCFRCRCRCCCTDGRLANPSPEQAGEAAARERRRAPPAAPPARWRRPPPWHRGPGVGCAAASELSGQGGPGEAPSCRLREVSPLAGCFAGCRPLGACSGASCARVSGLRPLRRPAPHMRRPAAALHARPQGRRRLAGAHSLPAPSSLCLGKTATLPAAHWPLPAPTRRPCCSCPRSRIPERTLGHCTAV